MRMRGYICYSTKTALPIHPPFVCVALLSRRLKSRDLAAVQRARPADGAMSNLGKQLNDGRMRRVGGMLVVPSSAYRQRGPLQLYTYGWVGSLLHARPIDVHCGLLKIFWII